MIIDFLLVTVSIVLLTVLTVKRNEILNHLERNSVVAGIFISVVKLMILSTKLESIGEQKLELTNLFIMVLICFRSLMIGVAYKYLFWLLNKILCKKVPVQKSILENSENFSLEENENLKLKTLDLTVLSRREIEVARLASKGYTNAQIAEELYISTETVKRHMATIFEKLNLESRKELMLYKIQ